jgi:hypothetical protein
MELRTACGGINMAGTHQTAMDMQASAEHVPSQAAGTRGQWKDVEPVPPSFRVGCINLYVIVGRESVLPPWLHTFPIQMRQKWL